MSNIVWALAESFRNAPPTGWRPSSINVHRDGGVVRGGGGLWDVTFSVHGYDTGRDRIGITVLLLRKGGRQGRVAPRLFRFLGTVAEKMKRRGYRGTFSIDRFGHTSAHFHRPVKGLAALRREIAALASLRIGEV